MTWMVLNRFLQFIKQSAILYQGKKYSTLNDKNKKLKHCWYINKSIYKTVLMYLFKTYVFIQQIHKYNFINTFLFIYQQCFSLFYFLSLNCMPQMIFLNKTLKFLNCSLLPLLINSCQNHSLTMSSFHFTNDVQLTKLQQSQGYIKWQWF